MKSTLSTLIMAGIIGGGLGYIVPEDYVSYGRGETQATPAPEQTSTAAANLQVRPAESAGRLISRILASGALTPSALGTPSAPSTPSTQKQEKVLAQSSGDALRGSADARYAAP